MIKMTETPQSSQIKAHGYDPISKTLAIVFRRGDSSPYHYAEVTQDVADGLAKAESPGKFFGAHIKGKFTFTKVDASAGADASSESAAEV